MSILQLVTSCATPTCSRSSLSVPTETPSVSRQGRLWIDPVRLLELTHAPQLGQWALVTAQRLAPPALPAHTRAGRPRVYTDLSIFLTSLVATAWHWSYEDVTAALAHDARLAQALGYPTAPSRTISLAQYSRRVRALGLLPYLLFLVALTWTLLHLGVIHGRDVIIDSSYLDAWYKRDSDAGWSRPFARRPRRFGYKIHALICRWSYLPLLFVITPANVADSVVAIPLLGGAVLLYGLRVLVVRADAGYFTYAFLGFIHDVLHASAVIDYNLRRLGKRFLATLFFIRQCKRAMRPRSNIERHFAFLKRYYGLADFQVKGWSAVYRYALQVHIAMLLVALVAARLGRPDLTTSRSRVLAYVT